jgi:hypothetical protein
MCYSAQILADYKRYVRDFGADISIKEFFNIFWRCKKDPKIKIAKAMEDAFADATSGMERDIRALIDEHRAEQETKLQQELFKQRKRLADAERSLQAKSTKKALDDQRIATSKVDWALGKLVDLHRTETTDEDSRIFPQHRTGDDHGERSPCGEAHALPVPA